MNDLKNLSEVSGAIKALALGAMKGLSPADPAYSIARSRTTRPVDYMRCAEFDAILGTLRIAPNTKILDVSSPQWFSLYLAAKHPETTFHYINIVDDELLPYEAIARVLGLKNLAFQKGDVRKLEFDDGTFDKVISISVIEHVYPERGGDLGALVEIKRVLKPGSELLLTLPFKAKRNIVYMDGPVYERGAQARNFFAREYDKEMFDNLIDRSGFTRRDVLFICERKGLLAVDYYEWGPGKSSRLASYSAKVRRLVERFTGKPIDEALARSYLSVSGEINGRVVNIFASLLKA
jgi:SAM-dependent methyltransferase